MSAPSMCSAGSDGFPPPTLRRGSGARLPAWRMRFRSPRRAWPKPWMCCARGQAIGSRALWRRPPSAGMRLRQLGQPVGELIEFPIARQGRGFGPGRHLVGQGRQRRPCIHGGDRAVESQRLGLGRKAAGREHLVQRAMAAEQVGGALWPDAARARQLVGRIAAQCDEIWHLFWLDAVALAHLRRPDTRRLGAAHRIDDRGAGGGELERVAVAARHQHGAAAPLLGRDRGGEKIVGLVAGRLAVGEAARGHELRQQVELLDQRVIEVTPALIGRKLFVPIRRREKFPAYQSGRDFDDALVEQLDLLPQFVAAGGFANGKAPGYEADDFLAAAVAAEERRGGTVLVASGDRDTFQLASASTTIIYPVRGAEAARIGPAEVRERYGVEPKQVPDFIALRGDPSDKLPGARGIGPKGAGELLHRHGTLDKVLAAGRFPTQAEALRLYRSIATMDPGAPLPPLPDQVPTWAKASALARDWELNQLADRLAELAQAHSG